MSRYSVRKPLTVFVAVIIIILLGVISFTRMQTDLFPNMELPYVVVYTSYPGATPEKVEQEVTKPLEQALQTTSNLSALNSVSQENVSMIILEFTQGTDMDSAMLEMSGYVDMARGYFDDSVGTPTMLKINPDMMPVMVASIDVNNMDRAEVTSYLNEIMPSLERIPGVASVDTSGRLQEQLHVQLNQQKIDKLNARVTGALDDEFADAEQEMDDARAEIDSGKDQLQNQGSSQSGQLAEGLIRIRDAKTQIQLALSTIATSLPDLEAAIPQLQTQREQLAALKEAMAGLPMLEAAILEAEEQIPLMEQGIAQLQQAVDALKEQLALAETMGDEATIEAITSQLTAAQAELDALNAAYAEATAALEQLKAQRDQLQQALSEAGNMSEADIESAIAEIDKNIAAAEQGIQQMKAQQSELQQSLQSLSNTEKQLEQGKITMSQAMAEATAQIAVGENALEAAQEQLEQGKEQAYDSAQLDGVITKQMISGLLTAQNFSMPAGYVESPVGEQTVKVGDEIVSREQLEQLVLMDTGMEGVGIVRLIDVADVSFTDNSGESYARINGNDGIILMFSKQSSASTAEVSRAINAEFEQLMQQHEGLHITQLQDQGVYIDIVTDSVIENLLYGGLLAIVILIIFLGDVRPTIVIALSIPISLMFSMVLMYFSGVSLNVISLGGLALAVGMLVDNSIVAIENIYRLRSMGVPVLRAAVEGAKQVAGPLVASTLTTVCVFMPILFVQGLARQVFQDMGLTIAYSLLASLVVALTLVPAAASGVLGRVREKKHPIFDWFMRGYQKLLGFSLRHKFIVLALVIGLLVVAASAVPGMGMSIIPNTDINQMSANLTMPEETEQQELYDTAELVMERILQVEEVQNVGAIKGGGLMSFGGAQQSNQISFYIMLDEEKEKTNTQIRNEIVEKTRDLDVELQVSASVMDISMITGSGLEVEIKGEDLDTLAKIGEDVAAMIEQLEGTYEVTNGMEESNPEKRVVIDREKAMEYGLTTAQVYQEVSQALAADAQATDITIDGKTYPVLVSADEGKILDEQKLEQYTFTATVNNEKEEVRLSDIAGFEDSRSPNAINRDGQTRVLTATAMIDESHNISLVVRDFESMIAGYELPEGYTMEIVGENEFINDSMRDALFMIIIAVVMIYLIMVAQFQSLLSPFIIMFTIPLAFTGGLFALMITGFDLSLVAMLGFLMLSGIIVNNGIVFVDYTNELRLSGMERREALHQAGNARMRPILMTAFTTILGLSTLAMGMGMGADMLQPLAVVTIGGLIYATALTLLVVPVLYDIFSRRPLKARLREEEDTLIEMRMQADTGEASGSGGGSAPDGKAGEKARGSRRRKRNESEAEKDANGGDDGAKDTPDTVEIKAEQGHRQENDASEQGDGEREDGDKEE